MTEKLNTDIEAIARLSKLSLFDYDRVRCEEANKLGVLVSTLDEAVKKERDQHATQQNANGHPHRRHRRIDRHGRVALFAHGESSGNEGQHIWCDQCRTHALETA